MLLGDPFHRGDRLAGTLAGSRRTIDDDRRISVIEVDRVSSQDSADCYKPAQRHHCAVAATHIQLVDVADFLAKLRLGLDNHLEDEVLVIEVVYKLASQIRL